MNLRIRTKIKLTYTIICSLLLIFSQIVNRYLNIKKYRTLIRFISLFILIIVFVPSLSYATGYKISVKISGHENDTLLLGYYFADKQGIVAEEITDAKGRLVFSGEEKLPEGLYFIVAKNKYSFDILVTDDQVFGFKTDTNDVFMDMEVSGSKENSLFFAYQKQAITYQKKFKHIEARLANTSDKDSTELITKELDEIIDLQKKTWKTFANTNKGTFFSNLLYSMNGEGGLFFDNIDFSDERLLRTPSINRAVRVILARNLNANKPYQSLIAEMDSIIVRGSANDAVYQYIVMHYLSFAATFERIGMNNVFVHLAEKYILPDKATWLEDKVLKEINERYKLFKSSTVGQQAEDIEIELFEGEFISLYDLKAKYTFVFFWSTGCGHCKTVALRLRDFYNDPEVSDVQVFAVYTKNDRKDWEKFYSENELPSWTNGYDPENKSNYRMKYYVVSSPIMYLLDENRKIVAVRAGDGPIIDLIDELNKQKNRF